MMSATRKTSMILLGLSLAAAIAVLLVGSGIRSHYLRQRQAFERELLALPVFVPEIEQQRLIRTWFPDGKQPTGPRPPLEELKTRAEAELNTAVERAFPPSACAAAIKASQQGIAPVKPGDRVKFEYAPDNAPSVKVEGIYEMKQKTPQGPQIVVGGKFYHLRAIAPDDRAQFLEGAALRQMADAAKNAKAEFLRKQEEFARKQRVEIENRLFKTAGYVRDRNSAWVAPDLMIEQELQRRKQAIQTERERRLKELAARYTVMGMPMFKVKLEN